MDFDQIGKYRILSKIGEGAMGEVHKAHDPFLNRDVAIKTISSSVTPDTEVRLRFLREAQSAARINHPNIITVYDFGEEQGKFYMAMELLEGRDLKEAMAERALGPLEQKLAVIEQICDGLAFAHSKDVVHRDLKPANIHIQPDGQVKIMDFGLARFSRESDMTRDGTAMGTPHYMSPEQVRGEKADSRSDVFTLGAVFYEILSERKPFDGDSMHTVLFHVLEDEPEPLRGWVDLPEILVQLVEKALSKDPNQRFQSGSELLQAVRAVRRVLAEGRAADATLASELGIRESTPAPRTRRPKDAGPAARAVVGAVALDPARMAEPVATRRPSATLSGRVPGRLDTDRQPRAAAPASRLPIYAGAILALVAVAGGTFFLLGRTPRPAAVPAAPAAGAPNAQIGALTEALVGTQVELARRKLQDKNYSAAISQAQRALKLDPGSSDARQVLAEAESRMKELEAAASEARSALAAGDEERASVALWRILSIDPSHPAATELVSPLRSGFRGRAEAARRLMGESRSEAERVKAGSLEAFTDATSVGRVAESLFGKGEFAAATRKFLEARDGFDRAHRAVRR